MLVSAKEAKVIQKAIDQWEKSTLLTKEEAIKLSNTCEVVAFDWKRLAKYSFWLAIACILISISAAFADKWLMDLLKRLFTMTDMMKCIFFAAVSGGFYFLGIRRKGKKPEKIFSNEAILFLGVVNTAISIAFLGIVIDTGTGHYSLLLLLACAIYGVLGLWFESILVWIFALLSLASWFGAETGYISGWGAYYLGMNYPLRFVFFGLALIFVGHYVFTMWHSRNKFLRPTRAMGLLYLLISLWIMSIFGNYSDAKWFEVKQYELLHWSVLFAAAALAAIWHGLKYDDTMTKGFGLTFIFINLYTRFFEYFWNISHKAIFFAILALSFWYLGSRAESIWQMKSLKHTNEPDNSQ